MCHEIFASPEWRDIPGYEGSYQASSAGQIRSLYRIDSVGRSLKGQILKPSAGIRGLQVTLSANGLRRHGLVRRLVMIAFAPPLPPDAEVTNLNGLEDNRLTSLV